MASILQPKTIHFVNDDEFIRNPYDEVKKVEEFLQIEPYFRPDHFVFDLEKKLYCINGKLFNATKKNA